MTRRFGIEIEFGSPINSQLLSTKLTEALPEGVSCIDNSHGYRGNAERDWMLKYDGSVNVGRSGMSHAFELVSPPLDFDTPEQRAQVDAAAKALQDAGCQPLPSGGIHVHIEALNDDGSQMTARQVGAVVRFFYKFEDAIYRIASSGWDSLRPAARTYAKPIPQIIAKELGKVDTGPELVRVWDGYSAKSMHRGYGAGYLGCGSLDRYFVVNLRSYFLRNTIEFRCFNGSVNGDRMQAYIALSMAMVQDARAGHNRYVSKNYPLGAMHSGQVDEKAVMLRLQQVLRSDSRDTHVLMSKEDWKNLRKTCWRDSKPQASPFPT